MAPLSQAQKRILQVLLCQETPDAELRLGQECAKLARRGYCLEDLLLDEGLEDLYRDQLHAAVARYKAHRQGHLYLAFNASYVQGLYKIGATRKSEEERRRSLRTAGVPGRFEMVKSWPVPDAFAAETACRNALWDRRVERDFYSGTYAELTEFLDTIAENEYRIGKRLGLTDLPTATQLLTQ